MKKIKLFLCVALFGAMSFGAFSAYDYYTMSAEEKALLENIEALTSGETPGEASKTGWSGWESSSNPQDFARLRLDGSMCMDTPYKKVKAIVFTAVIFNFK